MLAKAVHVDFERRKMNGAVALREKEYYFRIDTQKMQEPLEPGMLAFSSDGQLVYVLGLIDDKTPEEEATYTGVLTKIFALDPIIKSGGRVVEPKMLSAVEKVIYTGMIVELVDKRFKKTNKKMKFKATEKIYGQISKGDIVPINLHTRDGRRERHYVLVQQIFENAGQKLRLMKTRRRTVNWFYKKTDKGYRKTRYAYAQEVIESEEIEKAEKEEKSPKKQSSKQQSKKRQSEVSKSEKALKEADKEFNRAVHSFVIRKRKD